MIKRTHQEIERDYKLIKMLAETGKVTTMKELCDVTNLSVSAINTSLSKHPRVQKKIMSILRRNIDSVEKPKEQVKKEVKDEKIHESKLVKNIDEQEKGLEYNEKTVSIIEDNEEEKSFSDVIVSQPKKRGRKKFPGGYVIDTSIIVVKDVLTKLTKICDEQKKIIITNTVLLELEKIQKFDSFQGYIARHILKMALDRPDNYINMPVDESITNPDDRILKFCEKHINNAILITADKAMALKAKYKGICYIFENVEGDNKQSNKNDLRNGRVTTLKLVRGFKEFLFIPNINTNYRHIKVFTDGVEKNEKEVRLQIGDEIYLVVDKYNYLSFMHFKMTSLNMTNNCVILSAKRIYNKSDIDKLYKADYKTFVRDFVREEKIDYII